MARQLGGHPAKQDPEVAKLFKTLQNSVMLTGALKGRLSDENYLKLQSASLGLMFAYAEMVGLPQPDEVVGEVFEDVVLRAQAERVDQNA